MCYALVEGMLLCGESVVCLPQGWYQACSCMADVCPVMVPCCLSMQNSGKDTWWRPCCSCKWAPFAGCCGCK